MRLVGMAARRSRPMSRLLCLLLLVSAVPSLPAQQWPTVAPNPYAQPYPNPYARPYPNPYAQPYPQRPAIPNGTYGYPQGGQPIQRAQNVYYGNYQNNRIPGYIYPRNYSAPTNYTYGNGGNGVTYYYVQNPNGPNYYPLTTPYRPASTSSAQAATPTWPAPAAAPRASAAIMDGDSSFDDGSKPIVTFHRPTNDCFWFRADYLASFIRPMRFASPLATVGVVGENGALGQPSTSVVFGKDSLSYNLFSGARVETGLFLDRENRFSLDMGGFLLLPNSQSFSIASDANGNPLISRPLIDFRNNFIVTSTPNQLAGMLSINSKSEMGGLELNARFHGYYRERIHLEGLAGVRYLRLAESLQIQDQLTPLTNGFLQFNGAPVTPPGTLTDRDSFRTVNQFIGPQIGGRIRWDHNWFTLDGTTKLAVGASDQRTTIDGSTTAFSAAGAQTTNGGILAVPSNIGNHNRTIVGIIPEFGLNLGVELTQHVRLQLGYSLLMWNRVVRPGSQFDPNVNLGQVPGSQFFGQIAGGPANPSYRFNDEFFWVHSFNLGLEIHY
jgi:hypothetical protein